MEIMITSIGNYSLEQTVLEAKGLKEFSEDEDNMFAMAGASRMLKNERIFHEDDVIFNGVNWKTVLGVTQERIYKISLQILNDESGEINSIFRSTLKYLIDQMGKYNEHPFLSKKYYWDKKEGSVIYEFKTMGGNSCINLFLTSSSIAEQMKEFLASK